MGMETALTKPELAKKYMEGISAFQELFEIVLQQSDLPENHAEILSHRLLAVYQGYILLGRISSDIEYLEKAKVALVQIYKEYCAANLG